jgi:hypothetical protein
VPAIPGGRLRKTIKRRCQPKNQIINQRKIALANANAVQGFPLPSPSEQTQCDRGVDGRTDMNGTKRRRLAYGCSMTQ